VQAATSVQGLQLAVLRSNMSGASTSAVTLAESSQAQVSLGPAKGTPATVGSSSASTSTAAGSSETHRTAADAGDASAAGSRAVADQRYGSATALLRARADVSVLRDLKIGPLIGRGSYGRVYRGALADGRLTAVTSWYKRDPLACRLAECFCTPAAGVCWHQCQAAGRPPLWL
jgi:hypothetical protein